MEKINLSIITFGDKTTGSSRIRVYNLLPTLQKKFTKIEVNHISPDSNILLIQKQIKITTKTLLNLRKRNIFIIFDTDDYFPGIYNNLVKYSDLITTSTEYLKQKYLHLNPNIIIIPNAIDINDYNIPIKNATKQNSFVWYGASQNSSILDKLDIRKLVKVISNENFDIKYNNKTIDSDLQNFSFNIVPQEQNEHTLAKTHCRILKALYLGIPTIMSNLPEYKKLATELEIPQEYIVNNLSNFKPLIKKIKSGKVTMPSLNFIKIRKKILEIYSKEKIATELAEKIKRKYNSSKNKERKEKTKKLKLELYKQKINHFFLIKLIKKIF